MVAEPPRVELMAGAQTEFYLSEAKHPAFLGGRGSSKTFSFSAKAFKLAASYPGIRGVLTQPTFDMIRRNFVPVWEKQFGVWRRERAWAWRILHEGVPSEVAFANGSTVDLRPAPADPAGKVEGPAHGLG